MKTSKFIWPSLRLGVLAATVVLANQASAQFTAFNDHVPGTIGTQTAANATTYSIPIGTSPAPFGGTLKDITSGNSVPVTVTITATGAGSGGNSAGVPAAGTPCYNLFNGIVYFGGTVAPPSAIQIPTGTFVTYTFSNLTAGATYNFRGAAVRGGNASNYSNRWTRVELIGASSATAAHTAGIVTSAQEPADLTTYQVAAGFGENHLASQGDVVGWDSITPSGTFFQVVCTRYVGALPAPGSTTLNNPPYGYAINGFQLIENNSTPTPIAITVPPTNQTIVQCKSVTFHVGATGSLPQYQWFSNNVAISGANSADYTIASVQPSHAADYKVTVSNNLPSSQTTTPVHLTVTPAPALAVVSAVGTTNPSVVMISFNQAIDPNALDLTPSFQFGVALRGGGGDLGVDSATVTNGTNLILVTSTARTDGANYDVTITQDDPSAVRGTCAGSTVTGTFHVSSQVYLVKIDGTWQFNQSGVDPGASWIQTGYNDTSDPWQTGQGIFDGKNSGARTTLNGQTIHTTLNLSNNTSIYTTPATIIPTYEFRTHFSFPGNPATAGTVLLLHPFIDDGAIFFINGQRVGSVGLTNPPAGVSTFTQYGSNYQSRTVGDANFDAFMVIPLANVVAGDNVLAVELKQERNNSSDITMGLELTATIPTLVPPGPRLIFSAPDGFGDSTITWTGGGVLQQSIRLGGPDSDWTPVPGSPAGSYSVNPHGAGGKKFYRVH